MRMRMRAIVILIVRVMRVTTAAEIRRSRSANGFVRSVRGKGGESIDWISERAEACDHDYGDANSDAVCKCALRLYDPPSPPPSQPPPSPPCPPQPSQPPSPPPPSPLPP